MQLKGSSGEGRLAGGHVQPRINQSKDGLGRDQTDGRDDSHDLNSSSVEPIAIIGMGMRLPGGVRDASGFWDLLVNGRDGRCRVPANRYTVDTWYGPGQPLHVSTQYGNFLQHYNPAHVDTSFWSMSKEEAETMDPEQRLLLEVVYEAFESSGRRDFCGDEIGVYVGTMGGDWDKMEQQDNQHLNPVRADIYGDYILANRVSYEFDLKGPSIVLRTACSSSLSALHMACQDIRSGECTSAMVCGTNLILAPRDTVMMTDQGVLSPSGSSRSFDADADGYGRGEAVNAILVKKLSDALRDNDPIRAVIRNTCISGDGKTPGLTVPNPSSHENLIRRAYRAAGINDLSTVAMVECHGTGTAIGDPIEIEAVANVWGEQGIYIGSVKPNIGHGEGASGLSSVIKMVLALENHTIPPNINFKNPNPRIPWDEAKLVVPTCAAPWPAGRLERVSVNSFGIGGANAHVILESPACNPLQRCGPDSGRILPEGWQYLLPFSTKSQPSLLKRVEQINSYLSSNPQSLGDVAYSLSAKRESHCFRAFSVVGSSGDVAGHSLTITKVPSTVPKLIWVFTGQGAQWAQMSKELVEKVPFADQRLNELQTILDNLPEPPSWTLRDALFAPKDNSRLYEAEISQPCLAALQIILVDLLRSWGVEPAAVVGHSSGETGAGYAAGVLTAEVAMFLAYHRGQITPPLKAAHRGGMAAVGMGSEEVGPYLQSGVIVGCENSPSSVSLTGDKDVLERVMEDIRQKRPGVLCRLLQVECAYHSRAAHMFAIRDNFDTRVAGIAEGRQPRVPFYSSVTGKLNTQFPRVYWSTNMVSPVLFSTAVEALLSDFPSATFIELGPHSAMSGPLRQILQKHGRTADYIPTLVRNTDGHACMLSAAGQLWVKGFEIDLSTVNTPGNFLTDLPTYPWHYDAEYWVESRISRDWRLRKFRHQELLGVRVIHTGDAVPAWRCTLRVEDVPWLRDHVVGGDIVLPATGYISMIGEAIRQLTGLRDYSLRNVKFLSPLTLGDETVEIVTALVPVQGASGSASLWHDFSICSLSGETWTRLVVGQSRGGQSLSMPQPNVADQLPRKMAAESFYYACQRRGLTYGHLFRGLTEISTQITEGKAKGTVADLVPSSQRSSYYAIHPTALDACLHVCMASACRGLERNFTIASIPKAIEEMYITEKRPGAILVEGETSDTDQGGTSANVTGNCNGQVVFQLRGLEVAPFSVVPVDEDPHAAAILEWKPDIDLISPARLLKHTREIEPIMRINRIALACILETRIEISALEGHDTHLTVLQNWLAATYEAAARGTYVGVPDCKDLAAMKSDARQEIIREMLDACKKDWSVVKEIATRILWAYSHARAFFLNGVSNPHLPTKPGCQARILEFFHNDIDMKDFFTILTHKNPSSRVLLIGAGSGELLGRLLGDLRSRQDEHLYNTFTVVDSSQLALDQAKDRLKNTSSIEFMIVDLSRDMLYQGLKEAFYDLVIMPSTTSTWVMTKADLLRNIRRLIHPRGRLIIQDLDHSCSTIEWLRAFEPDWRPLQRNSSKTTWHGVLLESGFDEQAISTFDGVSSKIIVTRPAVTPAQSVKRISVLCHDSAHPHVSALTSFLATARGIKSSFVRIGQELALGEPVISLVDLEEPFLHDLSPDMFLAFKKSLMSLNDTTMLWVTGACQIGCQDPNYAITIGTLRTIRHETSAEIVTLELDKFDNEGWKAVADLVDSFQCRRVDDESTDPDSEYVFSNGDIKISKFHAIKVADELMDRTHRPGPKTLSILTSGSKQHVQWVHAEEIDLTGDSVEIVVKAITIPRRGSVGFEGAGVVSHVGPHVRLIEVGNQVVFFGGTSCSTRTVLSEVQCVKIGSSVNLLEAVAISHSYIRAVYALEEVARLSTGQSLLINGACSATGLAALLISGITGAEVYCAVETREEAEYLYDYYDMPEDRVSDYRASPFLPPSSGKSFDVVLNLEAGASRATAFDCVAPCGIFIDIIDSYDDSVALQPVFLRGYNRIYASVDFPRLTAHRTQVCQSILTRVLKSIQQGQIHPRLPIKPFKAPLVEEALVYAQNDKAKHWEQVVLTIPEDSENALHTAAKRLQAHLHPDRTYVFVGGLGGLGQAIARFLVERGARHLIFFSRSAKATAQEYSDYIRELEHQGCNIQAISGDVSVMDDVRRMVAAATHPIAGVLHAAMVLQDVNFADMTFAQWQTCILPKVRGAWNLHNALQQSAAALDFFFLFSSVSGLGGHVGQANYAAANTFLDAFVQFRQSLGLPCSVLDIGLMRGIGILEKETYRLEAMRAESLHALHEQDLLDALEVMLDRSYPGPDPGSAVTDGYISRGQMAIGMRFGNTPTMAVSQSPWMRDPRTLFMQKRTYPDQLKDTNRVGEGATSLKEFLRECNVNPAVLKTNQAATYLAKEIAATLSAFRMREGEELDLDASIEAIGVDSLLSIELRKWLKQKIGVVFKMQEIRGAASVRALGILAARRVLERLQHN